MKEITTNLAAGEDQHFYVVGNYFRILEGGGDVRVRFPNLNINSVLQVGIGVQLERFHEVILSSESNQKIIFAAAVGRIDDSRLTGVISTTQKGGASYSAPDVVSLTAGVSREVLPQDLTRLKGVIQPEADIYIGSSSAVTTSTGIKITADTILETDNSAALWAICQAASSVRILQEFE